MSFPRDKQSHSAWHSSDHILSSVSCSEGHSFMEPLKDQKCHYEKWLSELGCLSWRRKDLMGSGHDNSLTLEGFLYSGGI